MSSSAASSGTIIPLKTSTGAGAVVHTYNPTTQEGEAERFPVQGQSEQFSKTLPQKIENKGLGMRDVANTPGFHPQYRRKKHN